MIIENYRIEMPITIIFFLKNIQNVDGSWIPENVSGYKMKS